MISAVLNRTFGQAMSESSYSHNYHNSIKVIESKQAQDTTEQGIMFPDVLLSVNGFDSSAHDKYVSRKPFSLNRIEVNKIVVMSDVDNRPLAVVARDNVDFNNDVKSESTSDFGKDANHCLFDITV